MSTAAPPNQRDDLVSHALAMDRLGVPDLLFFVLSAATPLTVVAGVITTGYATTGLVGMPVAFLVVAIVLALFAVGYVAMARHLRNAGAFYAYVARGLGKPVGVGAAWLALISYSCLQIGLYGAVGAAASPMLQRWANIAPPWWLLALIAWACTAALGVARVDVSSRVLAVLLLAEISAIIVYSLADLARPAEGLTLGSALEPLSPAHLLAPGFGALLVLAVLGCVGFESAVVFSEESRNPRRTVPAATYAAIAVTGALYALAAWSMSVAVGPDHIIQASRDAGPELVFALAADQLGNVAADVGHVLFMTSIFAALVSFHGTTARYAFALGREGVLPVRLGRTSMRTGAPVVASIGQSLTALSVIIVYAVAGWDPITRFFWVFGTDGGFGVLILLTLTSLAVVGFFLPNRRNHTRWSTFAAPAAAASLLVAGLVLAALNLPTLLGVPPGDPLIRAVPEAVIIAVVGGCCWGLVLRARRPAVYAAIGLGDAAARPHPTSTAGVWS